MERRARILYDCLPAAGLLLSVGVLTAMAWQVSGALTDAHRVYEIRESVVAGIVAEDAAFDAVSRMSSNPGEPFTINSPTGLTARVAASNERDRPNLRIAVDGKKGRTYRYECDLLPGAAPESLGNPLSVRHRVIADRPAMRDWLRQNLDIRLHTIDDKALTNLLDPELFDPAGGSVVGDFEEDRSIGLLRLLEGTDRPDFRIAGAKSNTWRPVVPATGVRLLQGNLWINRGDSPLKVELQRSLTVVVTGNVYVGRSVIVRGPGRLMFVAWRGGSATYVDLDGSGDWSKGDRPIGTAATGGTTVYRGPMEGSGSIYLGLPGGDPSAGGKIRIDASLVSEAETYVCAGEVTAHGALVVGQGVTWIGAAELHLPGDDLPNVERERVPGFRRTGVTRPGMLLPVR